MCLLERRYTEHEDVYNIVECANSETIFVSLHAQRGVGLVLQTLLALHINLKHVQVAMKIIDKRKAQQDPYVAKNFRREAKLLQMIRHPNILQLYEVIETDSNLYLITEKCSGI